MRFWFGSRIPRTPFYAGMSVRARRNFSRGFWIGIAIIVLWELLHS
jgi:hypothetical protein